MVSPERYQQIKRIYEQAVDLDVSTRRAFLEETCAEDAELLKEVESLIEADRQAGTFISTTALETLAQELALERKEALQGRRLGRYQFVELVGAGGMGEVYRAVDTDLQRDVAIKVLPAEYLSDAERIQRFQREARVISALNHPNIITIYEIFDHDEISCLVTEFIDGLTLRQRLAQPISLPESLYIATQISDALESAHQRGIVHRDLKPENVMIREDGLVKVLDFGLAKLAAESTLESSKRDKTEQASAVGTIHYMSPEQTQARDVDHRTDIFSFGTVLLEMITGEQPFTGDSDAAIFDEILNQTPASLRDVSQNIPERLSHLIRRCLEKMPEDRFASFAEIREEISEIDPHASTALPAFNSFKRAHQTVRPWLFGLGLFLLLAIGYISISDRDWSDSIVRSQPLAEMEFTQLSRGPALDLYPSLSPDGKMLAYASQQGGNWDIYLYDEERSTASNLTPASPEDDLHPAISPDGKRVVFRSNRSEGEGLYIVNVDGSDLRKITSEGHNPVWSPDGKEIAYARAEVLNPSARGAYPSPLRAVSLLTGEDRLISKGDAVQPNWSPSGKWIAYWGLHRGGQRDIWIISARGGDPIQITNDAAVDWNPVWSRDGEFLYFASDRRGRMNLWRTQIDQKTGRPIGEPAPVTIPAASSWYVNFARDVDKMAFVEIVNRTGLALLPFSPADMNISGRLQRLSVNVSIATNPHFSPDAEYIVFDNLGSAQEDIFLINRDGSGLRSLTNDSFKDRAPRWHPLEDKILFFSDRTGSYQLWSITLDNGDLSLLTDHEVPGAQFSIWSSDGKQILENRQWGPASLLKTSDSGLTEVQTSIPLPEDYSGDFIYWSWSQDQKKIAGWKADGRGIHLLDLEAKTLQKSHDSGSRPVWLEDGRHLIFFSGSELFLLDSDSGESTAIYSLEEENFQSIEISEDNRTILVSLSRMESGIWLGE